MSKYRTKVCLAGIVAKIVCPYRETLEMFRKYECNEKPSITVAVGRHEIETEKRLSGGVFDANEYPDWYFALLAIHRKFGFKTAKQRVLLVHASAISVEEEAYLFAAPSGTGKSTHALLWRKVFGTQVKMINDDKPLVRVEEDGIYVYGSPWNGKHKLDRNVRKKLSAICFLEQSATNEIKRLSNQESYARLCRQIYFPSRKRECEAVVHTVGRLFELPMYLLKCNISEEAARLSYHTMRGGDIE